MRAASLTATPAVSHKSRSMLHHACLLCTAALHCSPPLPRTSAWRERTDSVSSALRRHGRSSAAAAALRARELAAPASTEIWCTKSGREHWAKGLNIGRAGCKREVAARCFVARAPT